MGLLRRVIAGALGLARTVAKPSRSAVGGAGDGAAAEPGAGQSFADIYALIDSGFYDDALTACLAMPVQTDTAPWISLAEGMLQAGHADPAAKLLEHLIALHPADAALHERLALVTLAQADFAKARAAAERALELDPARPWPRTVLAECMLNDELFEQAESVYRKLAEVAIEWFMCRTIHFSRAFFDELNALDDKLPPPQTVMAASSADFDYVVLVSCDSKYFEQFGGSFVNAYARNAGARGLLHVHVVDPPAEFAETVARLAANTGVEKIAVTSEANPFPDLPPSKQRVFYTCARFLHFGGWLEAYGKPVVCFDVDAIIEKPLAPLIEACRDADLGLVWRKPRRAIWLDTVGYTVVGLPTPAALAYFRLLRRFLLSFAQTRMLYWQIDQIALRCALIMQRRFDVAPVFVDIFDNIVDIAWLLARSRVGGKAEDPVYLGYKIEV